MISASILSCDHAWIGRDAASAAAAGAGSLHVDIMDGTYVENMTFGPQLVRDLRKLVDVPMCVHLEVASPELCAPLFFDTPCQSIVFQADTCRNPIHLIKKIQAAGKRAGAAVGPAHDVSSLRHILRHLDEVIVMSVEPGYAGQQFEPSVYGKLRQLRQWMAEAGRQIPVSVDGGVTPGNIRALRDAGADVFICGSYLFRGDMARNAASLLEALG